MKRWRTLAIQYIRDIEMHVADDDHATRGLVDQGRLSSMMCGHTVRMWVRGHVVGCHMLLHHQNKFKCHVVGCHMLLHHHNKFKHTPQLSTRRLACANQH